MAYEIIALDLDGTLLDSNKEITKATKQAITSIMEAGKKVVLASGRPTKGMIPIIEELGLSQYESYVISYNGSRITNCKTGEHVYNATIPCEFLYDSVDVAERYDMDLVTYDEKHIYCNRTPNDYTTYELKAEQMGLVLAEDLRHVIDFPVNKCMFVGDPKIAVEAERVLLEQYGDVYSIYRSEPFFVEVMPKDTDKATALERLLNHLGLTREQLICCGDGYNDIPMIEYGGLGVAMANAREEVKAKADFITLSNDEDGLKHVIETYMKK